MSTNDDTRTHTLSLLSALLEATKKKIGVSPSIVLDCGVGTGCCLVTLAFLLQRRKEGLSYESLHTHTSFLSIQSSKPKVLQDWWLMHNNLLILPTTTTTRSSWNPTRSCSSDQGKTHPFKSLLEGRRPKKKDASGQIFFFKKNLTIWTRAFNLLRYST
jgi:hypothetical protein